jgi:hypothetical protein
MCRIFRRSWRLHLAAGSDGRSSAHHGGHRRGAQKYTEIHAPVLAIFADPHNFGQLYADDPKARKA